MSVVSLIIYPLVSFAQEKNLNYLVNLLIKYLNASIYVILSLAVMMFVWNVYKYFIAGGDDVGAKKEAGLYVMWSVIGFFIILSFWGLVNIVTKTLNLDNNMPSTGIFGTFRSTGSGSNTSIFNGSPTTNTQNNSGNTNTKNP